MTREEQLACLEDRPCSVCKFHTDVCNRGACVFEEEPEEQEPCEDCISRQATIDAMFGLCDDGENPHIDAITDTIERIPSVTPQPRWIPVSERLPDIDEEVLVDDGADRFVAWWVDDGLEAGWHSLDESYDPYTPILAWMPLPQPYKAESEGEE